jgi:hypothetical protein
MSIFQRSVLLFKVLLLLLLSVGMSSAWAECTRHGEQVSSDQVGDGGLMLAKSESEPGDKGQGGSAGDDDSTTDEPDSDDADEGDSQT